jgi:hypothetical protein
MMQKKASRMISSQQHFVGPAIVGAASFAPYGKTQI